MTNPDEDRRDNWPEDEGSSLEKEIELRDQDEPNIQSKAEGTPPENQQVASHEAPERAEQPNPELANEIEDPLDTLIPSETLETMKAAEDTAPDATSDQGEQPLAADEDLFLDELGLDDPLVPESDATSATDDALEFQLEEPLVVDGQEPIESDEASGEVAGGDVGDEAQTVKLAGDADEATPIDDDMSLETVDFSASAELIDSTGNEGDVPEAAADSDDGLASLDWQEGSLEEASLEMEPEFGSSADERLLVDVGASSGAVDDDVGSPADADLEFKLEDESPSEAGREEPRQDSLKLDAIQPASEPMQIAPAVAVKRNPVLTTLKFVIGAVIGLMLFQVGAWWAGFDWFGLAPKLPPAIAWMAPASLREDLSLPIRSDDQIARPVEDAAAISEGATTGAQPAESSAAVEPMDESVTEKRPAEPGDVDPGVDNLAMEGDTPPEADPATDLESDLDVAERAESGSDSPPFSSPDTGFESVVEDETNAEGSPMNGIDLETPDDMGTGDRLPAEDPLEDAFGSDSTDGSGPRQTAPSPELKAVGPLPPRWFSDKEVMSGLEQARAADRALDGAQLSGTGLKKAARDFYVAMAGLAEQVTWTEPSAAKAVADPARQLAAQFEFDEKKLKLIGNAARQWFARDLGKGIVLTGSIESVEVGTDVTRLGIRFLGKPSEPVPVIMRASEGSTLRQGERLLIMGTIIDDPLLNLRGYDGLDDRVVWTGLLYPLP